MTDQKSDLSKANSGATGATGAYHANGFKFDKPTAKPTNNYKNYCFKCGKLKAEHKFLQGCPK